MPDSTRTRRDLIAKALELLLEESSRSLSLRYPLAQGDVLLIEVRREKPTALEKQEPLPVR